jgi:adenine-specific DNA-methyltransferase
MLDVSEEVTKVQLENVLFAVLSDDDVGDMPDTPVQASPAADEDDIVRLTWNPARGKAVTNDRFVAMDPMPEFSEGVGPQRNLIIEGDNWDALRWLRMTHRGKVRCILIDPPYNTGSTAMAYDDRFEQSTWLSWLKARLEIARDVLTDDGAIMICIDDARRSLLDLLMEQVMPGKRRGSLTWRCRTSAKSGDNINLSLNHEHILVYANPGFMFRGAGRSDSDYRNVDEDGRRWRVITMTCPKAEYERQNLFYPLHDPITDAWYPCDPHRVWCFSQETFGERLRLDRVYFPVVTKKAPHRVFHTREEFMEAVQKLNVPFAGKKGSERPLFTEDLVLSGVIDPDFWVGKKIAWGRPGQKDYRDEAKTETKALSSWLAGLEDDIHDDGLEEMTCRVGMNAEATELLSTVFGGKKVFNYAKPLSLIKTLVANSAEANDIVLDFFGGSGTTAHAVLELNADDDGNRSFIMVSTSEEDHNGGTNLCRDVCAERVRRVINGYAAPTKKNPSRHVGGTGGGFAYMRVRRVAPGCADFGTADGSKWRNANAWVLALAAERMPLTPVMPEEVADGVWALTACDADDVERTVAYAPTPEASGLAWLRDAATRGALSVWTECPSAFRGFPTKVSVRDTAREIRAMWTDGR